MKAFFMTFGCKVNQYETNCIEQLMNAEGFETTDTYQNADIAVINTCTVTSSADSKCRQFIRRISKENPSCIICAAGCMTQTAGSNDILPECAVIVGSRNKTALPSLIRRYIADGERIFDLGSPENNTIEPMCSSSGSSKTRAYIKIQDGCEMFCTYCAIPFARGKLSSKPLDEIRKEAAMLIASGHKEMILTGINLCCYGRELGGSTRLIDAIEAVCLLDGDFRVRLSSVEPEMITKPDIERMAALEKLCHHFHLSLQSGCDKTLKAMKRHYDTKLYKTLVNDLREHFENCAITTDIMVGFPGETDEDHRSSLDFAREIAFADGHIFPYSRRKGTVADKLPMQIDKAAKHKRALEMSQVISESRSAFLEGMLGKTVRVLFEKESSPVYHQGHSDKYTLVKTHRISPDVTLRRQMLDVVITGHDGTCCFGRLK